MYISQELNPDTKRYTWWSNKPLAQIRIDYWIIGSKLSYNVMQCDIKLSIKMDHSLLLSLKFNETAQTIRGRGLCKFNNSLLTDQVI